MRPVQFAIWLTFATEKRTYSVSQAVFRALSGKKDKFDPVPEKSVNINYPDDRLSIIWNPAICRVYVESVSDQTKCISLLLSTLDKINEAAPIEKIVNRRFGSFWILPQPNYDLAVLERKYREVMIAPNHISNAASDSSVVLDITKGKLVLHHQSGPMNPPQLLSQYLRFESQDLPHSFLFLESSTLDQNVISYAHKEMHEFLVNSMSLCVEHSGQFEQIWEGRL